MLYSIVSIPPDSDQIVAEICSGNFIVDCLKQQNDIIKYNAARVA